MSPSSSSIAHQVQCDDIWPFDELIADGEIDPANRLVSSELSKKDELDKHQSFVREREVLRKWRPPVILCISDCQSSLLMIWLSPDLQLSQIIQLGNRGLLLSQTILIDSQVSLEPIPHYLFIFIHQSGQD